MKLSEIKEINGKKLTTPQSNLLVKLEGLGVTVSSEVPQPRLNRFSGVASAPMHPALCAIVDFVYDCNTGFGPVTYKGKKVDIQTYDRARYLVLAFDSKAYGELLD